MRISQEYDRLLTSNTEMRKDLVEIAKQTQFLDEICLPLQIISSAFRENPELKDELWKHGSKEMQEESLKKRYF